MGANRHLYHTTKPELFTKVSFFNAPVFYASTGWVVQDNAQVLKLLQREISKGTLFWDILKKNRPSTTTLSLTSSMLLTNRQIARQSQVFGTVWVFLSKLFCQSDRESTTNQSSIYNKSSIRKFQKQYLWDRRIMILFKKIFPEGA